VRSEAKLARKAALWTLIALALLGSALPATARHRRHSGDTPGDFDYYLLSLSWSPAFCLQSPDSPECNGPRRFGFIVHGLWPQNELGWPQNCPSSEQLTDSVAQQVGDLMPARKLVYHEWSTHGTCSGLRPADFFALLRKAHDSVIVPPPYKNPGAAVEESPEIVVSAFMRANPRLPAQSVVATCSNQGAPRLREVHLCFDRDLNPRACSDEVLREACHAPSLIVPPIR
jgi:ribonuclease T2